MDSILPAAAAGATLSVDRYLGKTVFHATTPDSTYHVTADDAVYQPSITPEYLAKVQQSEMYYRSRPVPGIADYPVWKVTLEDENGSVFYVHPATAQVRYMDNTSRWSYWMYTALHTMRLPGIVNHEWLRQLLQWIFMLGGMCLSLTGIALALRSLKRFTPWN